MSSIKQTIPFVLCATGLVVLTGCSAITSTTNTAADGLETITHSVSAASRSSTDATSGGSDRTYSAATRDYVDSQMGSIRREAAVGGGEHIEALATLIDAPDGDRLGEWMQNHYAELFDQSTNTHEFIQAVQSRRG